MNISIPKSNKPRIVVVGGGFGGIEFCKRLKNKDFQIVLIDKHNYHTFQPLLYQVASGGLEADSIAFPLRKIFKGQNNLIFRVAKVLKVNAAARILETSIGNIDYDILVLATGSTSNYFSQQEIEDNSMPMKSIPEALNLRSVILQNLESALQADEHTKGELLNFVVVGGGPTGVETAGALGELKRHVLKQDYPELDINQVNIYLIEGSPELLGNMSEASSIKSKTFLEELGVKVMINTRVKSYDGVTLSLVDLPPILTRTVIWSAGVKGVIIEGLEAAKVAKGNRLEVDAYNKVIGYEHIYALGDMSAMFLSDYPNGHPGVAPVAIQQGHLLAANLIREANGTAPVAFKYNDKGSMATVGRNRAVVDVGKIHFQGIFAWFTWMFVHLLTLVGFRNKLVVFVNWVWSYFSYDRGTRLIIRTYNKKTKHVEPH